jgi:uncharacterized protein with HEPN domain
MSKRDIRLYLHDMLNAISKVERFTAGLDYERFESNEMVIDAVVRNLEVIGEAARNIPPDLRARYTEIEWHRIIGFRNVAIHAYFVVEVEMHGLSPQKVCTS